MNALMIWSLDKTVVADSRNIWQFDLVIVDTLPLVLTYMHNINTD